MGNRAIIKGKGSDLGVYVHWNGGYDSVLAFTQYCKLKGYRSPETDSYGVARLCQVIGNFFGGSLSVGIWNMTDKTELDEKTVDDFWLDNGVYELENWEIVSHWNPNLIKPKDEYHEGYDLMEMLLSIDESMPEKEQIKEYICAKEIPTSELKIGDEILIIDEFYGKPTKFIIAGIGEDKVVNGRNVKGIPYISKYGNVPNENINNYILDKTVRVVRD